MTEKGKHSVADSTSSPSADTTSARHKASQQALRNLQADQEAATVVVRAEIGTELSAAPGSVQGDPRPRVTGLWCEEAP